MNAEQLVAKIEANPCLARYFENWTTGSRICPCCVKKAIGLPDQKQFEAMLDAVIAKNAEFKEADRKLEEVRGQYAAVERHLLIQLGWSVSDPFEDEPDDDEEDNAADYRAQQELAQRLPSFIAKGDTRFFS